MGQLGKGCVVVVQGHIEALRRLELLRVRVVIRRTSTTPELLKLLNSDLGSDRDRITALLEALTSPNERTAVRVALPTNLVPAMESLKAILEPHLLARFHSSGVFKAEISVRSPRQQFIFIIKNQ